MDSSIPRKRSGDSFSYRGSGSMLNVPGGKAISNDFQDASISGPMYLGDVTSHVYQGIKGRLDLPQDCWKSLAFPEMNNRSNDIEDAAVGTCQWLSQHQVYNAWAASNRALLWIKGKPGSGKSTLLRYVLNNAMEAPTIRKEALILSFFFHGRGSELQKTPLGFFRSFLYQLREIPDALSDVVDTFRQRCETVGKPSEWQWHPGELRSFFKSSTLKALKTRPLWLFVDALDECGEENARNLVIEFTSLLKTLPSTKLKKLRICFTCRHYPILALGGLFEICVENENSTDISTFVQSRLSSFYEQMPSSILDLITERANGVFLWAWLVVKKVWDLELEGYKLKRIKAVILSIPQELDTLYNELLLKMGLDSLKLIQWICLRRLPESAGSSVCLWNRQSLMMIPPKPGSFMTATAPLPNKEGKRRPNVRWQSWPPPEEAARAGRRERNREASAQVLN